LAQAGLKSDVPRKRRTQAERSEEMRAKLAKAAFEVIAEKGHSAFRTAAVAAHAGVSEGAQVHHFGTKEGVILAALEYAFIEASRASAQRLASIPAGANPLPYLLADLREFFLGKHYWVALDIAIDSSKTGDVAGHVRQIAGAYRGRVYRSWTDTLVEAGWAEDDATEIVRMAASMLGGMGMRSLWEDVDPHLPRAITRMEQMILNTWPVPGDIAARAVPRPRTARKK
jgi:AcrR family transcriptional regulator